MENLDTKELTGAVADKERIKYLEDKLFVFGNMSEPPCFCCGYNGKGYFQKENHPCAERHFQLYTRRSYSWGGK